MAENLADYTRPTLIEVKAPHCVECRAMQPDLDAVAEKHSGEVDLVILDAATDGDQIAQLGVLGTPTLIAVNNGIEVARFTGRRSRRELADLFVAVAESDAGSVSAMSREDRLVWTVAGVLLTVVGLAIGPSWIMTGIGPLLVAWALVRGRR